MLDFPPRKGFPNQTLTPYADTLARCQTGYIDYDKLEEKALDFRPRMIICGGSAYPREWDYARLAAIAGKIGALLMCDMAHYRRAPIYQTTPHALAPGGEDSTVEQYSPQQAHA